MKFRGGRAPVLCSMCGEAVVGASDRWVLLNRWGCGSGTNRLLASVLNDDGEYLWEVGDEIPTEDELASGRILHFPACLLNYVEGRMVETDFEMKRRAP